MVKYDYKMDDVQEIASKCIKSISKKTGLDIKASITVDGYNGFFLSLFHIRYNRKIGNNYRFLNNKLISQQSGYTTPSEKEIIEDAIRVIDNQIKRNTRELFNEVISTEDHIVVLSKDDYKWLRECFKPEYLVDDKGNSFRIGYKIILEGDK